MHWRRWSYVQQIVFDKLIPFVAGFSALGDWQS
jgi:hypothetical protein